MRDVQSLAQGTLYAIEAAIGNGAALLVRQRSVGVKSSHGGSLGELLSKHFVSADHRTEHRTSKRRTLRAKTHTDRTSATRAKALELGRSPRSDFVRMVRGWISQRTRAPMIGASYAALCTHADASRAGSDLLGPQKVCYLRCVSFAGRAGAFITWQSQQPTIHIPNSSDSTRAPRLGFVRTQRGSDHGSP